MKFLRLRRTLGLRARVTVAFCIGTFFLAGVMAGVAYALAHNYLLGERESSAKRQAFVDARLVRSELRSPDADVTSFLGTLPSNSESASLVYRRGHWFGSSVLVAPSHLPPDLMNRALAGQAATQRFEQSGTTYLAVAVPLPSVSAVFVQVFSLRELNSTLHILSASLAVAAVVTALAGGLLGAWASRLAVQPLRTVAAAADEIARGNLDTRLQAQDRDLIRLAKAFNAMVDALQARIARDARFASDISHELRSPLTTLSASLAVLERDTSGWRDSQRQALELVKSETASFARLVEDLLEISRVDAGAAETNLEEVFAGEFLCQVAANLCPGVPIDIVGDAGRCVIGVDKRRMERVFANLVQNADRYAGGVVRLGVRRDAHAVRFEVDDAGPGIPPAQRERIFERFARGGHGHRATGTGVGLGLALAWEHVALHRGRIWVEDRPGGGARFVISLPLVGEESDGERVPHAGGAVERVRAGVDRLTRRSHLVGGTRRGDGST
ncbi:MAG: HAMP domain-containing histidine kinase [Acidothermus sp.]|nr:HAMP domain-containing histidine kinase [Acidothermus sp.]